MKLLKKVEKTRENENASNPIIEKITEYGTRVKKYRKTQFPTAFPNNQRIKRRRKKGIKEKKEKRRK